MKTKINQIDGLNNVVSDISRIDVELTNLETDLNILRTAKITTGSNVALAVDTDGTFDMTRNGNILTIIPNVTNTGAMTVTVDGQATLSVKKANDAGTLVDTEAGDSKQNVPMSLILQTSGTPVFILAPKGGSNIKSIQRGTATILNTNTGVYVSISPVDLQKSIVRITWKNTQTNLNTNTFYTYFLDSDTIAIFRDLAGSSTMTVDWEVIEFNNVKSLQVGNTTITSDGQLIPISTINDLKSMCFSSIYVSRTSTTYEAVNVMNAIIKDSTHIKYRGITGTSIICYWQVIEFN